MDRMTHTVDPGGAAKIEKNGFRGIGFTIDSF